jgi:RNA polymerase sigma-70 factor (ECF subfamily)
MDHEWLAERFEENRGHLQAVAYRMLGSASEADDAVQEAWLRLSRSDAGEIENLGGWLTTVVSRVCLDLLRSRKSRREDAIEDGVREPVARSTGGGDPEREALLADSVGLALMVVLDRLTPAERLAFVLHDIFAVPFEEIGGILDRSAMAVRQLASRARRRIQGAPVMAEVELHSQRDLVGRFLAALRSGDVEAIVAVLDPDFVLRADKFASFTGAAVEVHGARTWAQEAVRFYKGARFAAPALVEGAVGVVVAPQGRLFRVLKFSFSGGKIAAIDVVAEPGQMDEIDLGLLQNEIREPE